jgi:hypothetical protein
VVDVLVKKENLVQSVVDIVSLPTFLSSLFWGLKRKTYSLVSFEGSLLDGMNMPRLGNTESGLLF